jgi:hypothetical protein
MGIGQPFARVDLNPMPESTLSPSQGLRIWPLLCQGEEKKMELWVAGQSDVYTLEAKTKKAKEDFAAELRKQSKRRHLSFLLFTISFKHMHFT